MLTIVEEELIGQPVQILVSEWYYDRPAWWFLPPRQGSAADLRVAAGAEVFRELADDEPLAPGEATLTGTGRLRMYKGIVHVATRSIWGVSSEAIVRDAVRAALHTVDNLGFRSVAFPILGVSAQLPEDRAFEVLQDALQHTPTQADVRLVRF